MENIAKELEEFKKEDPEKRYFWVKNGKVIKDLKGLAMEIRYMDDATFYHHVNHEKNDFANWIADIMDDTYLANKVRELIFKRWYILFGDWYHRNAMIRLINKRVKDLEKIDSKLMLDSDDYIHRFDPNPVAVKMGNVFRNLPVDEVVVHSKMFMRKTYVKMKKLPLIKKMFEKEEVYYDYPDGKFKF